MRKPTLCLHEQQKSNDQSAHLCSLKCAFVVHCLVRIIPFVFKTAMGSLNITLKWETWRHVFPLHSSYISLLVNSNLNCAQTPFLS